LSAPVRPAAYGPLRHWRLDAAACGGTAAVVRILAVGKKERNVLRIGGKAVDREVLSLSRSPQFLKIIERSRRDFAAGRSRSLAEVRELFGLRARAHQRIQPTRKKPARG